MDFHSLTRKELQALCKQNKIQANITNIAMADSLAALEHVEGLEQFLNQSQSGPQQLSVDTVVIGSPVGPRTACRTSTRSRKPVIKDEPESSQPLTRTRRATRREVAEAKVVDQEAIEVRPETPAAPSTRRRAPLVSAAKKAETFKDEIGSVQRAYSTRRSVKLLEKTLEKLCLSGDAKIQTMKVDEYSKEESANDSETADVKEVALEKTEDGSPGIQMETNRTVHEEVKDKEYLKNLGESSDEKMDVNETLLEEAIECAPLVKLSDESQSKDFDTHRNLETEVSDEVKETVEIISLNPNSAYSPSESLEEAATEKESANCVKSASEEESLEPLTLTEKSPAEDSTIQARNGNGLNITISEASLFDVDVVEGGVVELQSESVTETLTDEDTSEEEETDENSHEEEETDLVEVEIIQLESVTEKEIDEDSSEEDEDETDEEISEVIQLRSETVVEKEINDDSSEEEEETDEEETDEDSSEEEEESADSDDDVDSEESELDTPLVNHNVVKAKVAIPEEVSAETVDKSITPLADVKAVQAEEANNKSPHSSVPGTKTSGKTPLPVSPFAADQLSGQFPRPSLPTPAKSSTKSNPKIQMIIDDVLDENEEKTEVVNEENDKKGVPELFKDKSLRELQKILKTKLQINNDKKAEKTRVALQALPENSIAVDELQKDN